MNFERRDFLKLTGYTAITAMVGFGCQPKQFLQSKSDKRHRPNIIFLLTDDQRWDTMGCAGNPYIWTPNMDAMAADGVRFTNSFVTSPICCASRASIFTGQYASRHGINNFVDDFKPEIFAQTYPAILRKAGYKKGFIGKYGVGVNMPKSEFDVWNGIEGQPTYEHTDENGNYKHLTSIMGEQCIDFIKGCDKQQPFCLSVSFKAPHVQDGDPRQFIYDNALADMYKDIEIPLPETAKDEYFEALPDFLRKETTEARKRWHIRFSTPEKYQESVKGYYRLITGVDIVLGKIREQLEKSGQSDNTVIILMGDNGFFLGEKGLAGKWYPLEESIRVPLVIYDPRLGKTQQGKTISNMAINIDIAPTILDLAGATIPTSMQGRSLFPLISGLKTDWRDIFLIEHYFDYEPIPQSQAVRTDKWKYIRYLVAKKPYEQLYDLETDIKEINNLADKKEYTDILNKLRVRCDELIVNSK